MSAKLMAGFTACTDKGDHGLSREVPASARPGSRLVSGATVRAGVPAHITYGC